MSWGYYICLVHNKWMAMKITNLGKLPSDENKNKNHKGKLPSQKRRFPIIENNKNKGYKRMIQRF